MRKYWGFKFLPCPKYGLDSILKSDFNDAINILKTFIKFVIVKEEHEHIVTFHFWPLFNPFKGNF